MRYLARFLLVFICMPLLLVGLGCSSSNKTDSSASPTIANASSSPTPASTPTAVPFDDAVATTTPDGLKYIDTAVGTGDPPREDQTVVVNYTGRLASNGKVFDSTTGRGPRTFQLSRVITGFAEGILTMQPGGTRTVYIPAALAYGANPPAGSGIPANADLIFDIELVSVQ